jgi:tryptophanase
MLYREVIAVCSEIHTKHINTLCGQNVEFANVKLAVHIVTTGLQRVKSSLIKTSQLILYRKIIAVCYEIHTKHINTLCGQNVELLNVKLPVHIVTTGLQKVKLRL